MTDAFLNNATGLTGPLTAGFTITPSDAGELAAVTRQVRVTGTGGTIAVIWASGLETTEPVQSGDTLDWRLRSVKATGTTATGLRGYY